MDIKDLSVFEFTMSLDDFKTVSDAIRKAVEALDEKLNDEGYTIPYSNPEIDYYKIYFVPSQGETWANREIRVKIEFFCWTDTSEKIDSFRI